MTCFVLAIDLGNQYPANQAIWRRAVSTAYYAEFHLLIDEAVGMWAIERQRAILARTFEHRKMKAVCEDILRVARSGGALPIELQTVARNFVELQFHRESADYGNSMLWSQNDVAAAVLLATESFAAWRAIRNDVSAQDYILQLFLPKLPRQ
jgi:hypothetical protein